VWEQWGEHAFVAAGALVCFISSAGLCGCWRVVGVLALRPARRGGGGDRAFGVVGELGHVKGGGALSAVAAIKSPVIFIGTGELQGGRQHILPSASHSCIQRVPPPPIIFWSAALPGGRIGRWTPAIPPTATPTTTTPA
jgi:hypothetical protein